MRLHRAAALAAALFLLSGCAGAPLLPQRVQLAAPVELTATPFFPQEQYQCGPAALATVLSASGEAVTAEQLVPEVFVPGREGSLQVELAASSRRHGRVPLPVRPNAQGLADALAAGYPVLVLQNLAFDLWPVWHYAVVVGLDPAGDAVILRSGTEQRLTMPARKFLISWKRSNYWGLVMAKPAEPPPFAEARGWIGAAAGFETTQPAAALQAYGAATQRWPQEALGWQALGNVRHAQGDRAGAVTAYQHALALQPAAETYNNLAQTYGELGCAVKARELIAQGLATLTPQSPFYEPLQQTQQELAALAEGSCRY